jgi:hypothetical protein
MASTAKQLNAKPFGWGADLDPKNRPAVPMEKTPPHGTGAHWDEPERQIPRVKVFRSVEHKGLTPVFGTACPPKGLSGLIRKYAYKLSEEKKSHWLLLLFADRVDEFEGILSSLAKGRPHNPLAEMGLASEFKHAGFRTRFGQHRTDVRRQGLEALILLFAGAGYYFLRRASAPAKTRRAA